MLLPARFVCAGHHGLAFAHRQVGDHAIDRRVRIVLMQHVGVLRQHRFGLRHAALRGCQLRGLLLALRAGLRQAGLLLVQGSHRRIVGRLLGVEILLGQKLVFVQLLGAVVVQLGVVQIGLGMVDHGLLGAQVFVRRPSSRLRPHWNPLPPN